jgi:tRNA-dihydrouridine synthase C
LDPILENAEQAALGGASWITIHGRTRMAGYAPPIHWEPIGKVRAVLHPLPVIANGDIWTLEDFRRCREITGCEHYMLGRGALVDPNLPLAIAADLGIQSKTVAPFGNAPQDWLSLFERFRQHTPAETGHSEKVARRIKQWTGMAHRFGDVPWFDQIKRLPNFESISEAMGAPL